MRLFTVYIKVVCLVFAVLDCVFSVSCDLYWCVLVDGVQCSVCSVTQVSVEGGLFKWSMNERGVLAVRWASLMVFCRAELVVADCRYLSAMV